MKIKRLFVVVLSFLAISFCFNINFASANNVDNIYLGGFPAGFSLQTRGAFINVICEVITENGLTSPAKDAGLKVGDTIYEINEKEVNSSLDIETLLKETINGSIGKGRNPFRQPHYILLNLAVGGINGGPDVPEAYPMRYEIDYVRVYQKK